MHIKLTTLAFVDGRLRVAGEVVETTPEEGKYLVGIVRAEAITEKPTKKSGGKGKPGGKGEPKGTSEPDDAAEASAHESGSDDDSAPDDDTEGEQASDAGEA